MIVLHKTWKCFFVLFIFYYFTLCKPKNQATLSSANPNNNGESSLLDNSSSSNKVLRSANEVCKTIGPQWVYDGVSKCVNSDYSESMDKLCLALGADAKINQATSHCYTADGKSKSGFALCSEKGDGWEFDPKSQHCNYQKWITVSAQTVCEGKGSGWVYYSDEQECRDEGFTVIGANELCEAYGKEVDGSVWSYLPDTNECRAPDPVFKDALAVCHEVNDDTWSINDKGECIPTVEMKTAAQVCQEKGDDWKTLNGMCVEKLDVRSAQDICTTDDAYKLTHEWNAGSSLCIEKLSELTAKDVCLGNNPQGQTEPWSWIEYPDGGGVYKCVESVESVTQEEQCTGMEHYSWNSQKGQCYENMTLISSREICLMDTTRTWKNSKCYEAMTLVTDQVQCESDSWRLWDDANNECKFVEIKLHEYTPPSLSSEVIATNSSVDLFVDAADFNGDQVIDLLVQKGGTNKPIEKLLYIGSEVTTQRYTDSVTSTSTQSVYLTFTVTATATNTETTYLVNTSSKTGTITDVSHMIYVTANEKTITHEYMPNGSLSSSSTSTSTSVLTGSMSGTSGEVVTASIVSTDTQVNLWQTSTVIETQTYIGTGTSEAVATAIAVSTGGVTNIGTMSVASTFWETMSDTDGDSTDDIMVTHTDAGIGTGQGTVTVEFSHEYTDSNVVVQTQQTSFEFDVEIETYDSTTTNTTTGTAIIDLAAIETDTALLTQTFTLSATATATATADHFESFVFESVNGSSFSPSTFTNSDTISDFNNNDSRDDYRLDYIDIDADGDDDIVYLYDDGSNFIFNFFVYDHEISSPNQEFIKYNSRDHENSALKIAKKIDDQNHDILLDYLAFGDITGDSKADIFYPRNDRFDNKNTRSKGEIYSFYTTGVEGSDHYVKFGSAKHFDDEITLAGKKGKGRTFMPFYVDLDGDGRLDVLRIGNQNSSRYKDSEIARAYIKDSSDDTTFKEETLSVLSQFFDSDRSLMEDLADGDLKIIFGYFNNDSKIDIFISHTDESKNALFLQNASKVQFHDISGLRVNSNHTILNGTDDQLHDVNGDRVVHVADMNKDGCDDLIRLTTHDDGGTGVSESNKNKLWLSDCFGGWEESPNFFPHNGTTGYFHQTQSGSDKVLSIIRDFNRDDIPDILRMEHDKQVFYLTKVRRGS